jgi:hypothetical protein
MHASIHGTIGQTTNMVQKSHIVMLVTFSSANTRETLNMTDIPNIYTEVTDVQGMISMVYGFVNLLIILAMC